MKIGIFTDTYLPDVNGVVTSVVLLKRKLEEHGHQVWIITNHNGAKIQQEGNVVRLPGVELKKVYGYKISQPIHPFYIEELKDFKFDIIHAQQEFGVGMYASIVAKTLNIPLVRTYHTAYEDYTSYFLPIKSSVIDNAAKKAIEELSRIVGDDCLRLIAPSKKTKEMLEGYGIKTKIEVIPTGLELEMFKPSNYTDKQIKKLRQSIGIKENEQLFIYLGRIGSEKSIDIIIKGFKKIKENKLPAKLILVGGGPDLEPLKKLTKDLDLEDYCLFIGKKEHSEVPLYYNASDCFISASTTETQGMTYVEALASGLPLICKKDEVLEDVLIENENGYFFNDENDLSNIITKFIELSSEKRNTMSNNSLRIADLYDADLFATNITKIYEDVIESFASEFIIEKIRLKDDIVTIYIESEDASEKVFVSSDTYLELGLRKGSHLTKDTYERIKKEEQYTVAYNKTLKKIAIKDFSERQIRDYLYANFELSLTQINSLIEKLKYYGFVDDDKYCFNKVNSYQNLLYSKKMMTKKLKEVGIDQEVIDKYVKTTKNEELLKAKKLSAKYNLMIHGKSLNSRKKTILKKLIDNGFSYDEANEAIGYLDFSLYKIEENEVLKVEALKAKKKYSRKYTGRELRNHVYNSLASKGFELDKIYAVIDEMEWDND